ncbi:MAG: TPM domain-containing protein [Verrucomicrobiota bacterium]
MHRFFHLIAALCLILVGQLRADDSLPPAPKRHFNDYAGVVPKHIATALDQELVQFEAATSNQIVVAIFPKLPDGAALEDFTVRTFHSWKIGQKDKNNGAALFVFRDNKKIYISTGYGLEGSLPDALCKRIIAEQIAPRFKQGDYIGGLTDGIHSIFAATKNEYKGTGKIARKQKDEGLPVWAVIVILVVLFFVLKNKGAHSYGSSGPTYWGGGGGGGSSGGGDSGGFSGGGGDSGGGGAGGDW